MLAQRHMLITVIGVNIRFIGNVLHFVEIFVVFVELRLAVLNGVLPRIRPDFRWQPKHPD